MIINGQPEEWFELNNKGRQGTTIKYISNCGRMKRKNGVIEEIPYKQRVIFNGKLSFCYRLLIEHFKPKTLEDIMLGRDFVDHITHNPVGKNVNDIRNLRWCTIAENNGFEEGRHNKSISLKGRTRTEETKRKMSIAAKNRSEEHKRKLSEARKRRHWRLEYGKRVYY